MAYRYALYIMFEQKLFQYFIKLHTVHKNTKYYQNNNAILGLYEIRAVAGNHTLRSAGNVRFKI